MVGVALLVFPKLALGLSGFETGVAVMPHVKGDPADTETPGRADPRHQRLLTTAAVIMSVFLITRSFVTTLLIPPPSSSQAVQANGRALAYLAHEYLGDAFGTRLRHLDDRDPLVRRRVGDGRPAEPGPALPAPVRDGAGLGPGGTPAGAGLHRHRLRRHLALRRRRRCPGRRLRHRRPRADHLRRRRRDPVRVAQAAAPADRRVRRHRRRVRLHHRREHRRSGRTA